MQLKYKDTEYRKDVSIVKMILAVEPVPEYDAVTLVNIVPYVELVPSVLTI